MLARFKFQMDVYHHDQDECEDDSCVHCTWTDYHDRVDQVAHWAATMDDWMSAGGRPPRAWSTRSWLEKTEGGQSKYLALTATEFECALRTLGELHDLGVVENNSEHLSSAQAEIAARVSVFYGFPGCQ